MIDASDAILVIVN